MRRGSPRAERCSTGFAAPGSAIRCRLPSTRSRSTRSRICSARSGAVRALDPRPPALVIGATASMGRADLLEIQIRGALANGELTRSSSTRQRSICSITSAPATRWPCTGRSSRRSPTHHRRHEHDGHRGTRRQGCDRHRGRRRHRPRDLADRSQRQVRRSSSPTWPARRSECGRDGLAGRRGRPPVDISDEAAVEALIAFAVERFGRLDVVDNNAARQALPATAHATMDVELWDSVFAVNARGTMLMCKHAIPAMAAGGGADREHRSGTATAGDDFATAYACTKAAIITLTRYVATQCAQRGFAATRSLPAHPDTDARGRAARTDSRRLRAHKLPAVWASRPTSPSWSSSSPPTARRSSPARSLPPTAASSRTCRRPSAFARRWR